MTHYGLAHMAPAEKRPCASASSPGRPGRETIVTPSSTIASKTWRRSSRSCRSWSRRSPSSPLRFGQALLRGRYMAAVAAMERVGVPVDVDLLAQLRTHWRRLQRALIEDCRRRLWRLRGRPLPHRALRSDGGATRLCLAAPALRRPGPRRRDVSHHGRACTPSWSRSVSSGTRWGSCGCTILRSGRTAATACCSRPSAPRRAATRRAAPNSSSARRPGRGS